MLLGDKQGAGARENTRCATGLSPGMNCLPHFTIALRRWSTFAAYRPAGTREALPGTILRNFRSTFSSRTHAAVSVIQRKSLSVGKHLLDAGYVGFVYERELLELTHAAGSFGAHQVALAGMAALDLAVGGELKALACAAVGLQL
jgi:hypothetical protein